MAAAFLSWPSRRRCRTSRATPAGAVCLMVDFTERALMEQTKQRFAAIVESSDDAIIAKDLNAVITDWNRGAERLFGYMAEEAIGRPITMLIPEDRHDEEPGILARLRRGERIEHYETVRRRKDGALVDIDLTVSPIKNRAGRITGASKIARDITAKRRAERQQRLLIAEMNHRIKNLFSLAGSIVNLSARKAASVSQLAQSVSERLRALARAHELTIPYLSDNSHQADRATTLQALIETVVAPYQNGSSDRPRIKVDCCDAPVARRSAHELRLADQRIRHQRRQIWRLVRAGWSASKSPAPTMTAVSSSTGRRLAAPG